MLFLLWTACKIHPRLRAPNKVYGVMYTYVSPCWLAVFKQDQLLLCNSGNAVFPFCLAWHLPFAFILISDLPSVAFSITLYKKEIG